MIGQFQGRYRFLSNFWNVGVTLDGVGYATVEHAYQAAKTLSAGEREKIRFAATPGQAKKMGRGVTQRVDWDNVKLAIMETLLRQKFQQPQMRAWLLETEDEELVEGNAWGDVFWGVCKGAGQNHLGKLLMQIRAELKNAN